MKRTLLGHTKFLRLKARLGIPAHAAAGLLEMLWHLTAREAPAGDIGRIPAADISLFLEWGGNVDELMQALVDSRFVDAHAVYGYVIHGWSEHCEDSVHASLARAHELFADGTEPKLSKLGQKERTEAEAAYAQKREELAAEGKKRRPNSAAGRRKPPASASASASASALTQIPETHTHAADAEPSVPPPADPDFGSVRTAMPDTFAGDEIAATMAADLGLDLEEQVADFCDHARSICRTSADWQADLRRWLRKSATMARNAAAAQRASPTPIKRFRSSSEVNSDNIRNFLAEGTNDEP